MNKKSTYNEMVARNSRGNKTAMEDDMESVKLPRIMEANNQAQISSTIPAEDRQRSVEELNHYNNCLSSMIKLEAISPAPLPPPKRYVKHTVEGIGVPMARVLKSILEQMADRGEEEEEEG